MGLELEPVAPDQFDRVYPLLERFENPRMRREDWRRMLFDLPWPVDEPHRGFMLVDGGSVVGFMGTLFSRRLIDGHERRFCNLSSWIVAESHRHAALTLLRPIHEMRDYTLLALSSSPAAQAYYLRLGFVNLETAQFLIPLHAGWTRALGHARGRLTTRPERIHAESGPELRGLARDMAGTRARLALIESRDRQCLVVAARSSSKAGSALARIVYASDWAMAWDWLAPLNLAFFRRLGTIGLRLDARHQAGALPPFTVRRELALPNLYRPEPPVLNPRSVDELYTEVVGQRF